MDNGSGMMAGKEFHAGLRHHLFIADGHIMTVDLRYNAVPADLLYVRDPGRIDLFRICLLKA